MSLITRSQGVKRKRRNHELQFLAPALETLETPAGPMPWVSAWLLVALALVALAWSSVGDIDILANAQGRIIPSSKVKPVQSLSGGKVEAFYVRDGDMVSAGDLLFLLDTREPSIELERARAEMANLQSDLRRIEAALALGAEQISSFLEGPDSKAISLDHKALLFSLVGQQTAKLARFEAQKSETLTNIEGAREQIARLEALLPLVVERINGISSLVDRQIVARPTLIEQQQKRIEIESDIRLQHNRIVQLNQNRLQIEEQVRETIADYRKTLLTEMNSARSQLRGYEQSASTLARRINEGRITAPVDGVVYQSLINAAGVVVQPAQIMMQIVPVQESLIVEVSLESKDVGFVKVGQESEVKVDAYPFTQYGLLKGKVLEISADSSVMALPNSESNNKVTSEDANRRQAYSVRIDVGQARGVFPNGSTYELRPGMTASAEIRTGDRKLIQYIFSPLQTKLRNAGHER